MSDFERLARFVTIYGGKPYLNLYLKTGDVPMSTSILITFNTIEPGRVRAQIGDGTSGVAGVFAEADDAPTAAAQVVKAYLGMNPPQRVFNDAVKAGGKWQFSLIAIERVLNDAVTAGGKVRIEYIDSIGHETTRTIHPSAVKSNGLVVAYDELRGSVRTFKLENIKAARAASPSNLSAR